MTIVTPRVVLALKLVVTIGLCTFLVIWIDWPQFWRSVRSIDPVLAVASFLILASGYPLSALKWQAILGVYGVRFSFLELTRIYLIASFLGQFLPTGIGGDVYRAMMTRKAAGGWSTAITAIFVERLSGILALAILGYTAAALVWLQNGNPLAAAVLTVGTIGGGVSLLFFLVSSLFQPPARAMRFGIVRKLVEHIGGSLYLWRRQLAGLALVAALSILFHLLKILAAWLIFEALGTSVAPLDIAIALFLVELAALMPISIGGIGVVEGSFIAIMSIFGIDRAVALASILIVRVMAIALSLLGAALFLIDDRSRELVRKQE